VSEGEEPEVG
jgi:hypothetical protein